MSQNQPRIAWVLAGLLLAAPAVWAAGGGAMSGGTTGGSSSMAQPPSPEELARSAYNDGVRSVNKAKRLEGDAAKASDEGKKQKLLDKSQKTFRSALPQFNRAVENNAGHFQAWNYLGFCQRHLGDYEAALGAYSRALALNPNYYEAIEYRAEAYLGLNRVDDSKTAYMSLFRDARPLADELLAAMHRWVDQRRTDAKGVSADELATFAAWIAERASVAQQTASLAVGANSKSLPDWK
jgi:tetratricopeptide (TPR) repeat protein